MHIHTREVGVSIIAKCNSYHQTSWSQLKCTGTSPLLKSGDCGRDCYAQAASYDLLWVETEIDANFFALITAYMHLDMLKRTEGNINIFLVLISLISACVWVHPMEDNSASLPHPPTHMHIYTHTHTHMQSIQSSVIHMTFLHAHIEWTCMCMYYYVACTMWTWPCRSVIPLIPTWYDVVWILATLWPLAQENQGVCMG